MLEQWQRTFWETVRQPESAEGLKDASIAERLGDWTEILTSVVVKTCESVGWTACAKGHKLNLLPVRRSEYLAVDVMAFADGPQGWRFPVAVAELENSQDFDQVAYSLWKILCIHADLRMLFCYRRSADDRPTLVSSLGQEVVNALDLASRTQLRGETLVIVGSRADSGTFPYGFFKWWRLETNTGKFRLT
jgi:hypothetical protein